MTSSGSGSASAMPCCSPTGSRSRSRQAIPHPHGSTPIGPRPSIAASTCRSTISSTCARACAPLCRRSSTAMRWATRKRPSTRPSPSTAGIDVLRATPASATRSCSSSTRAPDVTIKWVQQDPLVMNGEPFCYGSRLTVRQLLELRSNGYDLARILTDHPELRTVGVAAAFTYASEHPERYAEFIEADGSLRGPGYTDAEAMEL